MNGFYYHRRLATTATWHILHTESTSSSELMALRGECCAQASEGYAAVVGHRADPRHNLCQRCKLIADGGKQLTLQGVP